MDVIKNLIIMICFLVPYNSFAADMVAKADFEQNFVDPYGFLGFQNSQFGEFVPGHTGYCFRSSHAGDDGSGSDDFVVVHGAGYFDTHTEIYIKYYYMFEPEYINTSNNVKWLWTSGVDAHNEAIVGTITDTSVSFRWQLSGGGAAWNDGRLSQYGTATASKGTWMKVEFYFKLSSGTDHLNADGIQWLKINDNYVIYKDGVITGKPGTIYSPAINATTNQLPGQGWWRVDDYEVWNGIPDANSVDPSSEDITPPGDVTNENKVEGDGQVTLSWINPSDADYQGALVRYSVEPAAFPATYQDGTFGCNKEGAPGAADGCTITGLANDTQYNFSIFTYDTSGNYSQTVHISAIPQADAAADVNLQVWDANVQTGDLTWSDSGVVWTARVLVQGSAITSVPGANMVTLGFQGRASADYQVSKISIAEKDPNVAEADVVDSTWAKVTFDGNSVSSWGTDRMTVPLGTEKLTDAIPFVVEPGKDYYVTFQMHSPPT